MPRLYLIRHGKPAATWGGHDDDPGLDSTGQDQAAAARDFLLNLPEDQRPRRVVSSPLARCRETADPTAQALGVQVEIDPGVGEIPTPSSLAADARGAWLQQAFQGDWREIKGDLDYDAWRRQVAEALHHRGDTAVFSHFVAINAVVSLLTGEDRVVSFRPDHTSITVLETDGKSLTLVEKGREASTGVL
ncbi:histidine phosphatase family protein [Phenylobacterium sp.]|uniref:histidine phosphatase family protein n=1 Tax=Phenylobacterium sp. TaxID=1871053 RepID=UPI00272F1BBE|nr:histidine phosphatase family protein [Phenylobacterium sp.]MDP1873899.1 histidine phosphatase family protein [Phenylobacterium sp.]MDP3371017.1 histidine phosphatase family protein [Brevundimonas sp.]MDP3489991.1 histidine phosphatase family protein [Phenylobacterium sp.]